MKCNLVVAPKLNQIKNKLMMIITELLQGAGLRSKSSDSLVHVSLLADTFFTRLYKVHGVTHYEPPYVSFSKLFRYNVSENCEKVKTSFLEW